MDYFIGNSSEIKERITKYYLRHADVINPPVEAERFITKSKGKRTGFITASRQSPYKRMDLAIKACNELELPLTVIGNGSEHENLKKMAGPTITFKTNVDDAELEKLFHTHEAFIFPAREDFGIVPIEAMAAGMPVIAFGEGGVVDWMKEGVVGETFPEQTVESLVKVLEKFDAKKYKKKDLEALGREGASVRF